MLHVLKIMEPYTFYKNIYKINKNKLMATFECD